MTGAAVGSRTASLVERAERLFPGGVNSPVRAFRAVGRPPLVLDRGDGPHVWDADGRRYIDYIGAWGPAILGHAHPAVIAAITKAAGNGLALGATHPLEIELAEAIRRAMPSMERLRFTSSGTEAVMSALRLARAATGRDLVVKFAGAYHGHSDGLLVEAGSGLATQAIAGSAGVPDAVAATTIVLPYNDLGAVSLAFAGHRGRIAAVIVEPVAANTGIVAPAPGFLEHLRETTAADGALLVFDEVITGFRVGRGGAQERFGIEPDLTTLGKIIGGGMPIGAYGGRADLMDAPEPGGIGGTFGGNPLACRAALAVLDLFRDEDVIAANRARAKTLSALARPLAAHPKTSGFRHLGMIWAFEVDTRREDFASWCFSAALEREMLLRPIGRTIYWMPPYCLSDDEMALLAARTLDIVACA